MTALTAELDRKLAELGSTRASLLERLVRDAMALAEASPAGPSATSTLTDVEPPVMTEVQQVLLSTRDYEHLLDALDQPPRDLPRLRRLMQEGQ